MNAIEIEPDESQYDEWLDEIYGEVTLGNLTFLPSEIIKNCDPNAYRVGMADYSSSETRWECSECGEEYKTKEEAEECCRDEEDEEE